MSKTHTKNSLSFGRNRNTYLLASKIKLNHFEIILFFLLQNELLQYFVEFHECNYNFPLKNVSRYLTFV